MEVTAHGSVMGLQSSALIQDTVENAREQTGTCGYLTTGKGLRKQLSTVISVQSFGVLGIGRMGVQETQNATVEMGDVF